MKKAFIVGLSFLMLISNTAFAQKNGRVPKETVNQELGLSKDFTARNKEANNAELVKAINGMKAEAFTKLGITKDTLIKLVKNTPEVIDAAILLLQLQKSTSTADIELREILSALLDAAAKNLNMNASDKNNIALRRIVELLTYENQPKEVLQFAKKLIENLATMNLETALQKTAETYAAKKSMTVEKWLEELLSCTKA